MKLLTTLSLMVMLIGASAVADTLELTNGKSMQGTFVARENGAVKFETKEGVVVSIDEKDVKNIVFAGAAKSTDSATSTVKKSTGSLTAPAGTVVHVRMKDAVNSKHSAGHKFNAVLEADLVANGKVVAAKGSSVYGVLQASKQAGRIAGKSEMTIAFTGIMVNNQIKPIQSGEIKAVAATTSGQETVGRSARFAVIGALSDGSKGAKTGAKIGLGASLLGGGGSINISAGTLLDFPLTADFTP